MWFFGTPNTPGPGKFLVFGAGIAAGVGAAIMADRMLVGPDKAAKLRDKGISVLDSRQAEVYAMAIPFATAAGIALGMQRRTPTAGLTTTSQIAAAALLSTVAGAVINADSDKAGDYVTGIGVMSAATGAGILLGVRDEIGQVLARNVGLGLFGLAIGVAAPTVLDTLSRIPGDIRRGLEHAE